MDDKYEWGETIRAEHEQRQLAKQGYDLGDIFYRKIGDDNICFWHAFTCQEIDQLLCKAGFAVETVVYIGYMNDPGEILTNSKDGAILIKAVRN